MKARFLYSLAVVCVLAASAALHGQAPDSVSSPAEATPGYVIGPDDVLTIVFWRDKELSGEVTVRPDGRITLPLLNDIQAAGQTPEQLRTRLMEAAAAYITEPNATVIVKQINSRKVFILGNVNSPNSYPLTGSMTVLQLIAIAGGLPEFADSENISIQRIEGGKTQVFRFNYKDVAKGRRPDQNIVLRPGDTVVVP